MTQASDLGQIANVPGASYRARVNAGFQALASCHYGAAPPGPTYPLMLWADQSTGTVWQRDAANTAWAAIGELGPPFAWTAVAAAAGSGAVTGDVKATFRATADPGWVMMDDGSIGAAASGATSRADADCEDLFLLLWANVTNTWAPLQDATGTPVGRGASAAADWAASRRLVLPRMLGRALACAGWGAGLSDRALGAVLGEEANLLGVDEMPAHGHTTGTSGAHTHPITLTGQNPGSHAYVNGAFNNGAFNEVYSTRNTESAGNHSHTVSSAGGGQAHNVMQPTTFLHFQVKL
jgi:microcystin-dependent protein